MFVVTVSSKRFSDALVVVGELRVADVRLVFHPSLASAMKAASCLTPFCAISKNTVQTAAPADNAIVANGPALTFKSPPLSPAGAVQGLRLGTIPQNLLRVQDCTPFAVLGTEGAALGMEGAARRRVASTAAVGCAFTAHQHRTYLEAALLTPKPAPRVSKTPPPLNIAKGCFRCLASDHQVDACRDPVRCRICRASGHKSDRCKMRLRGLLRAAARRLRVPAAARARTTTPASSDEPPTDFSFPPAPDAMTDLSLVTSAAYHPDNMRPSSSSVPSKLDPVAVATPEELPCVDKFITDSPRLLPMAAGGPRPDALPMATAAEGSVRARHGAPTPGSPGALEQGTQTAASHQASSGEEYASGDLDSASDASGESWQEGRPRHADAWMSPGRPELSERVLFAYIEPPVPMLQVSSFIREALRSVAPLLPVDLLPSSLGAMLLRCESLDARNSLHLLGPIQCGGSMLHLLKPEETPNRFYRVPVWLAFVLVVGFPNEHWYEEKIKDSFRGFAEVAEIDPACLTGENFGPLRLLLEVNDRLDIPRELRVSSRCGVGRAGAVATVVTIRVWPREFQLDSRGNLATFFGPPAPPEAGPSLGPLGPASSQQQQRPQPHFYSLAFPPNSSTRYASNLQHAFDPLLPSAPAGTAASSATAARVMACALILARLQDGPTAVPGLDDPTVNPDGSAGVVTTMETPVQTGTSSRVCAAQARGEAKPLITYFRRRFRAKPAPVPASTRKPGARARRTPASPALRRSSKRLAAKGSVNYIDMTAQAVQRKALLNSLSTCSLSLKNHVKKRDILSRNLLPLGAGELRRLVSAALIGTGSDAGAAASGPRVPTPAE